jgi:hypothetical protein
MEDDREAGRGVDNGCLESPAMACFGKLALSWSWDAIGNSAGVD